MIGLFTGNTHVPVTSAGCIGSHLTETGPCTVNSNGKTTTFNPYRWVMLLDSNNVPDSRAVGTIIAIVRTPLKLIVRECNTASDSPLPRSTLWCWILNRCRFEQQHCRSGLRMDCISGAVHQWWIFAIQGSTVSVRIHSILKDAYLPQVCLGYWKLWCSLRSHLYQLL